MSETDTRGPGRVAPFLHWSVFLLALVMVLAGLREASTVFIPIVLGLLLAMVLWPVHARVAAATRPWVGAIVSCVVALAAAGLLGVAVYAAGMLTWQEYTEQRDEYLRTAREARQWLIGHGVPDSWVPGGPVEPRANDGGETAPASAAEQGKTLEGMSPGARDSMFSWAGGWARSFVTATVGLLLAIILMGLALHETSGWLEGASRHMDDGRRAWLERFAAMTARQTRRYLLVKTLTGLIAGGATALFLWLMGVPLALVWGLLSFLLNYIPNIGAFVSGLPPALLAIVHLDIGQALLVVAGLVVIETLVSNLLDPLLQGGMLHISFFVVLASLIFWGWLWGLPGAFLSVPITAAIVVAMRQTERFAELARSISSEPS